MEFESRHQCLIYEGAPSEILRTLAFVLKRKLDEGYRCLYLNSVPMVAGMRSTLAAIGIDVAYEIARASLILSSDTVAPGRDFNCHEMLAKLEDSLDQALTDGYKGLWATGDMSWEFGHKKDFSKLLEYELGLEKIFQKRKEFCGICQYHKDILPKEAMRQSLKSHSSFFLNETLTRLNPHYLGSAGNTEINSSNDELDAMIEIICKEQLDIAKINAMDRR